MRCTDALWTAAWANVFLHAAGLAFAALALEHGTPAAALDARTAYMATRPWGWTLGWATWMLCALALVAFLGLAESRLRPSAAARLSVPLASAGAAIDLLCQTLYITVLPQLAAQVRVQPELFLALERALGAAGLVVANGLYSVAVLLAAMALPAGGRGARMARWLGAGTFAAGMAMVAAGFAGSPLLLKLATGPTIGLFSLWTLAVARLLAGGRPGA